MNDMATHGTRTRAMWHQTNEHLAHGKQSVIMHEISGGIRWHEEHMAW